LAGETEVFGEILPRRHFVYHKSHLPDSGANAGHGGGKSATNRFSYGAASIVIITEIRILANDDCFASHPYYDQN
jgi:hypothetical protein